MMAMFHLHFFQSVDRSPPVVKSSFQLSCMRVRGFENEDLHGWLCSSEHLHEIAK
jgi:hypothetical protein